MANSPISPLMVEDGKKFNLVLGSTITMMSPVVSLSKSRSYIVTRIRFAIQPVRRKRCWKSR